MFRTLACIRQTEALFYYSFCCFSVERGKQLFAKYQGKSFNHELRLSHNFFLAAVLVFGDFQNFTTRKNKSFQRDILTLERCARSIISASVASEERVRELQDVGCFASATKNSGLNFREFRMEQYFPIDFFPKYLEFSDEWPSFQNFNSFLIFCKLSKAIFVSFVLVSEFSELLVECKTPRTHQPGLPKPPSI